MKFYIHCKKPDITMVIKWDKQEGTVAELAQIVRLNIEKKSPESLPQTSNLSFKSRGKILANEDIVVKRIKHMDDVDVSIDVTEKEMFTSDDTKEPKMPEETKTQDKASNTKEKMKEYLTLAESLVEKQRIRRAILLYEEVLKLDSNEYTAYVGIADCYLKAKRPQKALLYLRRLQKLNTAESDINIQFRLGQCYVDLGNADKAKEVLQKYCLDLRKSGGTSTAHKHQVQVLLAKAYLLKDEKDMALVILQGVLREDQTCVDALTEYAPLIYPLGPAQKEEAMTVLLTLLANNRDNSSIKEKFSWACQQPHGMKVLESVAEKAWTDVASLVFIATSIRECGAIEEATCLMQHAYELQKSDAHVLLTYVHMLELTVQHDKAVRLIRQYIEDFPNNSIGIFTCKDLQPITAFLTSDDIETDKDLQVLDKLEQTFTGEYSEDEKYLLALLHTLVKILYITGHLKLVTYLMEVLDPLSEGRDLHLTNIRNEAAYFTCISKVVKCGVKLHVPENNENVIYFIGDSHSVTPAWQQIQFKGEQFTIQPVLSTGTKIWHLRSESNFYPKINFNNAIKKIPSGAPVILCFGEIDCREALLYCVEKAKYDDLNEAIQAVIQIYIDVLKDLAEKNKWEIYVHPVMPVLDLTRSIVMPFNSCLQEQVQKEKCLFWLDFVDELLYKDDDGNPMLKDEYKFDGTHVHPKYTSLLQDSMRNIMTT